MSDGRFERALELAKRREAPGNREDAVALLEGLLAGGQGGARARFLLASLYDDRPEGMARAVELYRAGLDEAPGDAAARNNLAVALLSLGRRAEAAGELARVALEAPGYGLAGRNLAQLVIEHPGDRQFAEALAGLSAGDGSGGALARLLEAAAEVGRQEALESVHGAGHALKNLVGLAGSQAQALARRTGDEAARQLAASLEKLYGDWAAFLKAARASATRVSVCDLRALAEEVALSFPAAERPVVTAGAAAPALGDREALREALLNLVRNAREACPRGRVEIAVELLPDGRRVAARVSDEGPGIGEEEQRRLFEPGFTTKPQGSGFGLAIADRIARAAGGKIELESRPGEGASFTLLLPAAGETPPRVAPRLRPEEFTR